MTTNAGKLYRKISGQITTAFDLLKDLKICGKSLTKYVPSVDRKVKQATGSESARYWALDEVFKGMQFNKNDKFIDIGCGKGRILAEMIRLKFPGHIFGVELNPVVADYANSWASKYNDITVYSGDAFKFNYDEYTIIMLCRPFLEDMYVSFLNKLENDITHKVTIIMYADSSMSKHVKNREGWSLQRRDMFFKKGVLAASYYPFIYSIWTYDPKIND